MRELLRKPLTWMVIAECVVVTALVIVAWNVIGAAVQQAVAAQGAQSSAASAGSAETPSPEDLAVASPTARAPLPGLNIDSAFWRIRLSELNRDQVFFEQLEWRIVHSGMDAAQRYLETVVLPSLARAERG